MTSKSEYLKRYLENDTGKKRRKKKTSTHISRLKIIETTIDLKDIPFGEKDVDEDDDEAPVIAEITDDKPEKLKLIEQYESDKWKKIGDQRKNQPKEQHSSYKRQDSGSDASPSRKHCTTLLSSKRHDSDSDVSPQRNQLITHSSSKRHDSDNDMSPPRKRQSTHSSSKRYDDDNDMSPPRKKQSTHSSSKRYDGDNDMSPPRKRQSTHSSSKRQDSDNDMSPPRKKQSTHLSSRHDSDNDMSPPRKKQSNHSSSKRYDSDISPPRTQCSSKAYDSENNASPERNQRNLGDSSNQKTSGKRPKDSASNSYKVTSDRVERHDSDSDFSPKRNHSSNSLKSVKISSKRPDRNLLISRRNCNSENNSDSDFSPPRQGTVQNNKKELSNRTEDGRPVKTLSGLHAGLQNATTLKREVRELKDREQAHITQLSSELSGRHSATIVRDRQTGKKRDLEEESRIKEQEEKLKAESNQKYSEWGKGIEQNENRKHKLTEYLHEATKPLARHCDDEDLEEHLKSIIHDDDPMSAYMRKKRQKNVTSTMPEYKGPPAPPNRFGIKPGYRWDGVDRSNGFEKKYFEKCSNTKASMEESYLWSIQDM